MIAQYDIALALPADARRIAGLSREAVEHGLSWSWTGSRVLRSIHDGATNVAVASRADQLLGFGIMKYRDDEAHLLLLAVHAPMRHTGIGSALLAWLEASARVAGIGQIRLEARARNATARAFYRKHGFTECGIHAGYYEGVEDAVRMSKSLRNTAVA